MEFIRQKDSREKQKGSVKLHDGWRDFGMRCGVKY